MSVEEGGLMGSKVREALLLRERGRERRRGGRGGEIYYSCV